MRSGQIPGDSQEKSPKNCPNRKRFPKGGTIPGKCVTDSLLRFWFFIVQGIGLPEYFFLNVHIFTQQPSKTWPKKACQLAQDPFQKS